MLSYRNFKIFLVLIMLIVLCVFLTYIPQDAIRENSFYEKTPKTIKFGNTEEAFSNAEHIITGEVRVGGQEHFYMETQAANAIPKGEDDEIELIVTSQYPTELQVNVYSVISVFLMYLVMHSIILHLLCIVM